MIKVLVCGANGRMGQQSVLAVQGDPTLSLVAQIGSKEDLAQQIKSTNPDVVIDFTTPHTVYENTLTIIGSGKHPVIGTTGLQLPQIQHLQKLCQEKKLGGIIAPNFSLASVLMLQMSILAAKWFPHCEIIEMHHAAKKDSPSGTAIKTAERIAEARDHKNLQPIAQSQTFAGARGADCQGVPVHSVRLPGKLADQQVIFGNTGETLTISHTTIDRQCFMPGVLLACHKVMQLQELIYGLERLI
jgi:4-hydroxy-tetrahydrodipicolinate reductase